MKVNSLKLFLFFFVFLIQYFSFGQVYSGNKSLELKSLNVEKGSSQDYIFCITEDHDGVIWMGTKDGLNKFDGYSVELIRIKTDQAVNVQVRNLLTDHKGNIWIGTNNGLFCRLYETEKIVEINLNEDHVMVDYLYQNNAESIWIGLNNGVLFRYNLKEDSIKSFSIPNKREISSIYQENNELIIGFRFEGIARLNLKTERFYYAEADSVYQNKEIHNVKIIKSDKIVATKNGTYIASPRYNKNIFHYSEDVKNQAFKSILAIEQLNDSSVWIGTDGYGVLSYNPKKKTIRTINFKSDTPIKTVTSIIKSSNGLIWLGTANSGIHVYDPNLSLFEYWKYEKGNPTGLGGNSVLAFTQIENGRMIMGIDGGRISIYDPKIDRFFNHSYPNIEAINELHYSPIDKTIEIGTLKRGLKYAKITSDNQLELLNNKGTQIEFPYSVKSIYQSFSGKKWIGTSNGLYKLDGDLIKVEHKLLPKMITTIFEDKDSILWLGGTNELLKYNYRKDSITKVKIGPDSFFHVTSLATTKRNQIWVGSKVGLFKIDQEKKDTIHYKIKEGLSTNTINSLLYDGSENLWLGTNLGLVQMNIESETFRLFNKNDGIKGVHFNENAVYKGIDGRLYFGTTRGVYSFYPDEIVKNEKIPDIIFTKLELFNKEVKPNDKSKILHRTLNLTDTLNLRYDQNEISVEFLAVNYTNSTKNQFSYQLKGINNEWINIVHDRKVSYNNLPPGEYTFRIRASNNDGVWNNKGRKLVILISPPWWKTIWAYILYSVLLFLIFKFINKNMLKQYRLQDALDIEKLEKNNQIEINDLKTQFFMNISHEFKTPLTLIISPLERIIGEQKNNNPQKKKLVMIYKSAHVLLGLINQLMEFRKVELGKSSINLNQKDLVKFIEEVTLVFQMLADEKRITIVFEDKPDYLNWWFDSEKILKVIYNLLSNAVKHSPDQGCIEIKLTIIKDQTTDQIDGVNIVVIDEGSGIPRDEQSKVFDRFYRLKNDLSSGTGIGLSLSKNFVEMHTGKISVESELNKGSAFTVYLPLLKEIDDEIIVDTSPSQVNNDELQKKLIDISTKELMTTGMNFDIKEETEERYNVLVIEDEQKIREFIIEILEPFYNVKAASDGEEGYEMAKELSPDLIVSDVRMPKMDGFELCEKLKSRVDSCHIPIILLTALSLEEEQIKGLKTGADDYISKPFNVNTLIFKIKTIIENRRKIINRFMTDSAVQPGDIVTHSSDKELLERTIDIIKKNISNSGFKVEHIIEEIGMSRSSFFRKIKGITLISPNELIRTVRLKHAAELLLISELNISEITYEVGFVSIKYFRSCFKKQFGLTPSEYIKTNNNL